MYVPIRPSDLVKKERLGVNRFNHGIQALALSRRPMNGIAKVWALIALNDTTVFGLLGPQRAQASTETAVYSCALHVILFGCLYYS